jgi:polyribonucleotide nucleotidyltransferase
LQERYGVTIEVEDDGSVMIAAPSGETIAQAKSEIEALTEDIKVGTIYNGKVVSMKDFGAFIELVPGIDGMCHISELAAGYVKTVTDVVKLGDVVRVKVINVDDQGRIKLSVKQAALPPADGAGQPQQQPAGAGR